MSNKTTRIWQIIGGIHDVPNVLDIDSNLVVFSKNRDVKKRKTLKTSISKVSKRHRDVVHQLIDIMLDYYENSQHKIALQTPLSLFVGNPRLFYEVFWPQARRWTGRQYYILKFASPIDFELTIIYEIKKLSKSSNPRDNMLYLCSTDQRIPILTTHIEEKRQTIVPYEFLVKRILSFLMSQDDTRIVIDHLNLQEMDIERLVRRIVTKSKPVFIEFDVEKYKEEEMITISIVGKGSIIFSQDSRITPVNSILNSLKQNFLEIPVKENPIDLNIFPKSPISPLWIYIFAPPHYELHLSKDFKSDDEEVVLENNAPNNPRLISFRMGRINIDTKLEPLNFKPSICVPRSHKKWLIGLDKLLACFFLVWLLGNLYYLGHTNALAVFLFLQPFNQICVTGGFLEITFTLVSFVFIARNWFFHEESVYQKCSTRFLILLLGIAFLALLHIILNACLYLDC